MTKVTDPASLVALLKELFPKFEGEWAEASDEDERQAKYIGYKVDLSFHRILQVFAPIGAELLTNSSPKQIGDFCKFINEAVSKGGDLENAISTCLVEHATQLNIRGILKPLLSEASKKELR